MSKKILVLGASGLIGNEVAKQLAAVQVPFLAAVETVLFPRYKGQELTQRD